MLPVTIITNEGAERLIESGLFKYVLAACMYIGSIFIFIRNFIIDYYYILNFMLS